MIRRYRTVPNEQPPDAPQAWPPVMSAARAAAYMDECSVEAFLRRAGKVYPKGRKVSGRGLVWLKADLDRWIAKLSGEETPGENPADLL